MRSRRTLPDAIRVFAPLYVFGYYTDSAGVITSVLPDSPAAKVGLRIGDRVDMRDFAQADRKGGLIGKTYSAYNPQRHMTVVRDGVRMSYEINGVPEGVPTRGVILLRELVAFITILIGMLLAIVRPNRASLGFFHFVIGGEVYPNALTSIWLDYPWRMIVDGINDVLVAGAAIGLLMFALGFPRDIPVRWRIPVDVVGAIVWLASTALLLSADIGATYFARPALNEAQIYNAIQSTIYIGAMLVFIVTLIRSRGVGSDSRRRSRRRVLARDRRLSGCGTFLSGSAQVLGVRCARSLAGLAGAGRFLRRDALPHDGDRFPRQSRARLCGDDGGRRRHRRARRRGLQLLVRDEHEPRVRDHHRDYAGLRNIFRKDS